MTSVKKKSHRNTKQPKSKMFLSLGTQSKRKFSSIDWWNYLRGTWKAAPHRPCRSAVLFQINGPLERMKRERAAMRSLWPWLEPCPRPLPAPRYVFIHFVASHSAKEPKSTPTSWTIELDDVRTHEWNWKWVCTHTHTRRERLSGHMLNPFSHLLKL